LPFALALAVGACSTIPLTTAAKLAIFDENDFALLDPQQIRVRIFVPDGYTWAVDGAKLETEINAEGRTSLDAFELARVAQEHGSRGGSVFGRGVRVLITTLRLDDQAKPKFRNLQKLIAARQVNRIRLNVEVPMLTAPPNAKSVKVWIEIMLSEQQGYFTLIDGGTVPLNTKEMYEAQKR
jgi:hypothetical protein